MEKLKDAGKPIYIILILLARYSSEYISIARLSVGNVQENHHLKDLSFQVQIEENKKSQLCS